MRQTAESSKQKPHKVKIRQKITKKPLKKHKQFPEKAWIPLKNIRPISKNHSKEDGKQKMMKTTNRLLIHHDWIKALIF